MNEQLWNTEFAVNCPDGIDYGTFRRTRTKKWNDIEIYQLKQDVRTFVALYKVNKRPEYLEVINKLMEAIGEKGRS